MDQEQADKEGVVLEGIPPEDGRFCCDCAYLLGVRYKTDDVSKWRCVHPKNLVKNESATDLVTGLKKFIRVFMVEDIYALREVSTVEVTPEFAREYCGPKGSWYEKYIKPEYKPEPKIGGMDAVVFDHDALAANKKAADERVAAIKRKKLNPTDLNNL